MPATLAAEKPDDQAPPKLSKGQRTASRILDAAESVFAQQGYEATTLRQIASQAGVTEPALYNHFPNKKALYEAVLNRGLAPMAKALTQLIEDGGDDAVSMGLPLAMTDILAEHPPMAALFQQALQGDEESVGNKLIRDWLDKLLLLGSASMTAAGLSGRPNRASMAIHVIAMFNLTTGYFLSQRAFDTLAPGSILDTANLDRQKRLLQKISRALSS